MSPAKTAEPIEMPFGKRSRLVLAEGTTHEELDGVHVIGATWRILLNDFCAAAMRPYVQILWWLERVAGRVIVEL